MNTQRKTFIFPKIAVYGKRKVNQPEVEMELRYDSKGRPELSICGNVWNARYTDLIMGGQCLDHMIEYPDLSNNELFVKLYILWKKHHLNGMNAGSRSQEDALRAEFKEIPNYETACEYLKSINLYEDENGYRYGSSWLYREIPEEDLNLIKSLLSS